MKKLSQIISQQPIIESIPTYESVVIADRTPLILSNLSKIIEMTDDVYNTIAHLEESNEETQKLVSDLYKQVDALYEQVDGEVGIIPVQIDEALAWKMMVKNITNLGFERVEKPSSSTYTTNKGRIQHLFGIPMRAGKWADTFFVILDTENKPYGIIDDKGETWIENLGDALKELNKRAKTGELEETISEVLDPNDEAGVWIDDFVKSDDKRFEGKSKEERIKMALGAWYAAQKKESVEEGEETSVDKAEINNKIIALKSSLASIQAKQRQTDYGLKYDNEAKAANSQKLIDIPKKIKELQSSLTK